MQCEAHLMELRPGKIESSDWKDRRLLWGASDNVSHSRATTWRSRPVTVPTTSQDKREREALVGIKRLFDDVDVGVDVVSCSSRGQE